MCTTIVWGHSSPEQQQKVFEEWHYISCISSSKTTSENITKAKIKQMGLLEEWRLTLRHRSGIRQAVVALQ